MSRYSQELAQQRSFADQEFSKLVDAQDEKESKQQSKKADLEAVLAPIGASGIQSAGGRLVGRVLEKAGLKGTAETARDIIENPTKGISKLYQKGTQELSDRINASTGKLQQRINQMGVDREGVDAGAEQGTELQDMSTLNKVTPEAPEDIGLAPTTEPATTPAVEDPTPAEPRGVAASEVDKTLAANPDDGFQDLESLRTQIEGTENPFSFSSMRASENPLIAPKATKPSSFKVSRFDPDRGKLVDGPTMLQADDSAFNPGSQLNDLIDRMARGEVSTLDGVVKSQTLGLQTGQNLNQFSSDFNPISGSKVSPKISDLQNDLGLRPAQVPNQMGDDEVAGLSTRNTQLQAASQPRPPTPVQQNEVVTDEPVVNGPLAEEDAASNLGHNVQTGASQNLMNAEVEQNTNNMAENAAKKAGTTDIEDEGFQSAFKSDVEGALVDNTADLENPIGDVLEVGLGAALLFGSVFGSKVDHSTPQVQVANPTFGAGIRSD